MNFEFMQDVFIFLCGIGILIAVIFFWGDQSVKADRKKQLWLRKNGFIVFGTYVKVVKKAYGKWSTIHLQLKYVNPKDNKEYFLLTESLYYTGVLLNWLMHRNDLNYIDAKVKKFIAKHPDTFKIYVSPDNPNIYHISYKQNFKGSI